MIRYFKTFFYPITKTYSYGQPKEVVIATIQKILQKKVTLFSSHDMTGSFLNADTFKINIVSPALTNGLKYSSTLTGKVIETQNAITEIKTGAAPSNAFYVSLLLTVIVSLIYLFKFIQANELKFLFSFLIVLVAGCLIIIGVSNVAITAIYERYHLYIDKELKP